MEKRIKLFFALLLLFVVFFSVGTELPRRQNWGFFSDEAGYFSIIQSLAHDYDLAYESKDLRRIRQRFPAGPTGLFLKRTAPNRYFYAKSFAYPLLAAPFYRLFAVKGLLLLNGLMLFFILLMGYLLLKQAHPDQPGKSFGFALVFVFAGVTPVYIWWMTADLFNFFTMFCGLFFFFYRFKQSRWFYLSAFFFAMAVFSKPWNAAAVGIVYLILLHQKKWKQFLVLCLLSILVFSLPVYYLYQQTGELSYTLFQGGERRSFVTAFPYAGSEPAEETWQKGVNMSFDGYWERHRTSVPIALLNLFYYFFGRFTGMFIYFFPACFVLGLFFFQRKEPGDWYILAAIITAILVFTLLAPDNYFGGSGTVGNRYFFCIFPLFYFLGFRNRLFKWRFLPLAVAAILLPGVYADSLYHSATPRYVGMSTPISWFPPEKTQYLSLPTNENPRAFGQLLHDNDKSYQVYFLNDHYHTIENNFFWTKGDGRLEFFLAAPRKVAAFRVELRTRVADNKVTLAIEHKRRRLKLQPDKIYNISVKNIPGLLVKGRYIYHIKIKSDDYWSAFSQPNPGPDKRALGVRVHIGLEYEMKDN